MKRYLTIVLLSLFGSCLGTGCHLNVTNTKVEAKSVPGGSLSMMAESPSFEFDLNLDVFSTAGDVVKAGAKLLRLIGGEIGLPFIGSGTTDDR